jgi:leader peptidase (prepilin peptidase)/N-methyltransferase
MLEAIVKIIVFIFGSCVGSFLNVCIYRLPKEISIIKPRSFCPKCNASVKWYDNIPILSFIFLKGKCRHCRQRISFRYLFVEFASSLLFLLIYLNFGLTFQFFFYTFFFSLLIIVSFIDIDYHAIPDFLCILGILVGLIFTFTESIVIFIKSPVGLKTLPAFKSLVGLIFGLGFTYLFKIFGDFFLGFYLRLRKRDSIEGERESLGLGDVDFMGLVGVFMGIVNAVVVFMLAPFIALIYSIFALIFKKSHLISYLPYLSLAAIVAFFWGDKILSSLPLVTLFFTKYIKYPFFLLAAYFIVSKILKIFLRKKEE